MNVEVTMPQLGETVAEGTVTRWLRQVGQSVGDQEPLVEIATDKVDAEIPAPASGTLLEIRVAENATVAVGTVIAVIGEPLPGLASPDNGDVGAAGERARTSVPRAPPAPPFAAGTSAGPCGRTRPRRPPRHGAWWPGHSSGRRAGGGARPADVADTVVPDPGRAGGLLAPGGGRPRRAAGDDEQAADDRR